jgi:nitrate/nitrite-specific signal transduction histidine kinase
LPKAGTGFSDRLNVAVIGGVVSSGRPKGIILGKEHNVTCSVGELVEMAKALSEGEFEQQFQQHFQGELGQLAAYLEAVRKTFIHCRRRPTAPRI